MAAIALALDQVPAHLPTFLSAPPPSPDAGDLLTIDEAATWLRCSTKTLRRHVQSRRLPVLRMPGGRLLFDRHALVAALSSSPSSMSARAVDPQIARHADELIGNG